jgi:hypothetical protein
MATGSMIGSFTLNIDELGWTGQDLHRPESVVAEPDGTLWVSDGRGGVMRIDPDGGQVLLETSHVEVADGSHCALRIRADRRQCPPGAAPLDRAELVAARRIGRRGVAFRSGPTGLD